MISRKHLTYIKNRLRRGGKGDPLFGLGFDPYKATIRDIIRGLRLFKRVNIYAPTYVGMVTRRLNNIAFANLVECIKCSCSEAEATALVKFHEDILAMIRKN